MHSIVIVDDHPAIRLAVRLVMESSGQFQVVGEADNGPTAITVIREQQPSLVILELDLPRLSGLELIERIKDAHPQMKVFVFSRQHETIFASRAMHAGANGFMSKTENMQALVHAAQSVVAGYGMFPALTLASHANKKAAGPSALIDSLSERELAVLQRLARGMSNKEIGDMLLISNKTVSSYKTRIFEKLGISTIVELVDFAREHNLTI